MLTDFIVKHKLAALLLIVVLALALRLRDLGGVGFNEDEVQKVTAARSYLRGEFRTNLEHPMLMKSLITISLAASDIWNKAHRQSYVVPEELSVRLPNAIFGALTTVVIFLFAQELFGVGIGLLSALFWAAGAIAISVNRVAKEDTLLVFFGWLAYYLYYRAHNLRKTDGERALRFYGASGASFGLMLASKYFPHYLGLNALYYWLQQFVRPGRPPGKFPYLRFFGTCALVFICVNPLILQPATLKYMVNYVSGATVTHHGYLVMGHMYREDTAGAGGMPSYFYLLLLAVKTPIPILAALVVGLVVVWKRWREPGPFFVGFMFLSWLVPFSFSGGKWLRYMLAWMPAVYIIAAIGAARIWVWLWTKAHQSRKPLLAAAWSASFALVFVAYPAWTAVSAGPYHSLYLNAFGLGRAGYYFPHDEVNDMGIRPAARYIANQAPYGATVAGEAGIVFQYYFHKYGRDDLKYCDLSDWGKLPYQPNSAFLVLQDGRTYFENSAVVQSVESRQRPLRRIEIGGVEAARVYYKEELAGLRNVR